ncbi:MAG: 3-hydroxyacyl-CoA dehydrogenase family protein [Chrysiogenetes bacterium]|nr:3-hydroxyacyl-CoA dehydrogenase family protein [Chrysiogenetes bacterium]
MAIKKVGVVGLGAMGLGVVQVAGQAGFEVVAVKATPGSTDKASGKLDKGLGKLVAKEKISEDDKNGIMGRINFTDKLDALKDCDLIIESIIEDLDTKIDLFKKLEGIVSKDCILASNTSTLSITAMMAVCETRARVAGLHFFNPAPVMKLVEVVHAFETSSGVIAELVEFCKACKKDPVVVQDTTGFIVNRLLTPYMLSAIRLLEQGTGTIAGIDKAMKLGAAHPMGPFELADYIGLDVVIAMSQNIYADARTETNSPPHTLTRLVQLGYLGRKTGKGFYDYSGEAPVQNPDLKHPVA